ncbi:alpha/beta hydrolase [Novosphingobium sp. AAP93]|uniref:alpha/beta hydrolase n=1 Tax=Novosphingobium sp. AAP93 TaxID=1523427 RepID=UPI0009E7CBF0|nr:alpha/beta fold hydrolase [Novosphingobium sp. AAP93]
MKSQDMLIDVTLATGLAEQTLIAATLHLPDGMAAQPSQLIFAIHGGGYSRFYWHLPFADDSYSFCRWFTDRGKAVLTIDMLGMGQSSRPEPESQLSSAIIAAAHADALRQVVAQWDGPVSVIGVGHSMGGMMIIAQAAAHPAMDRVAVLGWANEPMDLGDATVAELQAALPPSGYIATPRLPMRRLFYWPDVPEELIEADEAQASTTPVTLGRDALTPGIVHEQAARIAVPVLVVQSAIDTSPSPENEPAYFSGSPAVELHRLENAAHCQNLASSREQHWMGLNAWIDRTS